MNAEYLGRLLAGLAERHQVPGAQLGLHRDGRTVLAETGVERYGGATPVSPRSAFPYGSVTKAFTATVVLQLVAAGDLGLDDPIGTYLPRPTDVDRVVTPRHLLSHTSGLPCDAEEPGAVRSLTLMHPPGTAFSYSNAGFVLAGALIAEITGMTWQDAVETFVLRPLEIEPAFCAGPSRRPVVPGHSVRTRTVPVEPLFPAADAPAGALAGSAADLVAFGRAHLDGRLPHSGRLADMRTGGGDGTPYGLADGWGLGLARFRAGDTDWFGHDGTTDGTTSHLRFEPRSGVVLALTTNASCGLALWDDLLAALGDAGLAVGTYPSPRIAAPAVAEVPDCLGDYVNGDVRYSLVRTADGAVRVDLDDGLLRELTFYEELRFCAEFPDEPPVAGRFVRDPESGEIGFMQVGGRVARRKAGV
ncbi:serine hydrolase domain-containing protein [Actinophytocola sp. KF-1]